MIARDKTSAGKLRIDGGWNVADSREETAADMKIDLPECLNGAAPR
jgi:hypothetical protein